MLRDVSVLGFGRVTALHPFRWRDDHRKKIACPPRPDSTSFKAIRRYIIFLSRRVYLLTIAAVAKAQEEEKKRQQAAIKAGQAKKQADEQGERRRKDAARKEKS
jgi:hypothetical protein